MGYIFGNLSATITVLNFELYTVKFVFAWRAI